MKLPLFAGFDLGGTHIKYGLIDNNTHLIFKDKADTPEKTEELLEVLKNLWKKLKNEVKDSITAAGFAFPGIFSLKEKKILQSPNYPQIDNFNFIPALSRFIDVPFYINNDANMAAYGEYKCGAGQGAQSMILITIGTGVGAGVILDGKLWEGARGFAGEFGHIPVNPEGEKCRCGSQGCLETEVSASRIVQNYLTFSNTREDLSSEEVFQRARKGDLTAKQAFARAGYYLGIGLAAIINFLNPERILLGGGVMKSDDFLLSPALIEAQKRSYNDSFKSCSIKRASLGNNAGFIGAALLAKNNIKN